MGWNGLHVDELTNVARNGPTLKLLTRDVTAAKDDNSYSYVNKLEAISKLRNIYESNRSRPDRYLSIRDFGSQIQDLEGHRFITRAYTKKWLLWTKNIPI